MGCPTSTDLTPKEIAAMFNRFIDEGGARIRWSDEVQGFVTYEGDRYPDGSVEDVVRGLQRTSPTESDGPSNDRRK